MSNDTEAFTIKELAEACNCTKIPVKKQLARLDLPTTIKLQHGKEVKAYMLTVRQFENIKKNINANKSNVVIGNPVTDNNKTITSTLEDKISNKVTSNYAELLNKYIEIKGLYDIEVTTRKLLEDRQDSTLQEIRNAQKEKEQLIEDKATITAELQHNKEELSVTLNQLSTYKKYFSIACITSLVLLLLILATLVIR